MKLKLNQRYEAFDYSGRKKNLGCDLLPVVMTYRSALMMIRSRSSRNCALLTDRGTRINVDCRLKTLSTWIRSSSVIVADSSLAAVDHVFGNRASSVGSWLSAYAPAHPRFRHR